MLPTSRHRLLATAASVTLMLAACGDGGGDDSNTPCSSLDIMREAQSLTADEASCILALHNAARASVTPAADPPLEPLQWDGGLAGAASAYAQTCPTVPATDGHGENLWKGTAGHFTIADAVNKWVSQKQDFEDGADDPESENRGVKCTKGFSCRHGIRRKMGQERFSHRI